MVSPPEREEDSTSGKFVNATSLMEAARQKFAQISMESSDSEATLKAFAQTLTLITAILTLGLS